MESGKFTFKVISESGKLSTIGYHLPPKSTNFGTLAETLQSQRFQTTVTRRGDEELGGRRTHSHQDPKLYPISICVRNPVPICLPVGIQTTLEGVEGRRVHDSLREPIPLVDDAGCETVLSGATNRVTRIRRVTSIPAGVLVIVWLGAANGCITKVGIPNFVSGPREYIMEGEYVILGMCSWLRISWFRIICWHCWRASGN